VCPGATDRWPVICRHAPLPLQVLEILPVGADATAAGKAGAGAAGAAGGQPLVRILPVSGASSSMEEDLASVEL
jgi:hypothetical protein